MVPVAVAAASAFAFYVAFRGNNNTTTKSIDADEEQEEVIQVVEDTAKNDPMIGLPLEDESESPEVSTKQSTPTVESSAAGESQELLPEQNDPTNKPPQVDTSLPEQEQPLKTSPKKSKKKKLAKMFSWTKKADKATKKRAAATTPTSSASDTASQSDSLIAGQ